MSPLVKAVIAGLPFIIAIAVGMLFLQPAVDDMNAKSGQVETKTGEKETLETKLASENKVNSKKRQLDEEIYQLRASVPKQPDLDLFTIDLEKMCQDSNMDLISIGPPKEATGSSSSSSSADAALKAKQDKVKGLLKGDVGSEADKAGAKKSDQPAGSDLEEITRQIVVTGSYHNLRRLIHKLETYQRVIKISQLVERIPPKKQADKVGLPDDAEHTEATELGDPKQLYVSMKVTAYYLP